MIDNDLAAEIAEEIAIKVAEILIKRRGLKVTNRGAESLQDVVYWMLRAEAEEI